MRERRKMTKPYEEIRFKGTDEEVRAQWLASRRLGIGGSDAAAIMGMSKYATPLTVWMEKTGRSVPEDISGKPAVYWGSVLEDVVAKEYAKRHPELKVRRLNAVMVSKEHPFMRASVDRVVTDANGRRGILECKTAGLMRACDWEEGIPDYYVPQPIHYLAVSGYEFYSVAVLIGGQDYREYTFERDQEDIDLLIESEEAFWKMVEGDVMPAPTGSREDGRALAEAYMEASDPVSVADSDIPELAAYAAAKETADRANEAKDAAANALKAAIGEAKAVETPLYKATWVRSEATRLDQKALKKEYPKVYEKFLTTSVRDGGIRLTRKEN